MQSYYVGLDVHSRESVFVVENEAGVIVARGSVPTTVNGLKHLRDSCSLPATTGITLETGTSAFFVARELARLELKPVVIDQNELSEWRMLLELLVLGEPRAERGAVRRLLAPKKRI